MNKTLATLSLSAAVVFCFGQGTPNLFDFSQTTNVKVIQNGDSLINAWAGGINYAQVSSIDLNLDGTDDLLVYDRKGSRVMPFLRVNGSSGSHYKYAPEYISKFPVSKSLMLLRDYNCDGKKDIFFNSGSDIWVWENTSTSTELQFTPYPNNPLQTIYSAGANPLYVSFGDIPVIDDIDYDGDLDILTFGNNSVVVEWQENLAHCGLNFENSERCYGYFIENGFYRSAKLNSCVPFKKSTLHSGSTMLSLDLDGDSVKDLILGNISYSSLTALFNGGSQDSAHFISQDTTYPNSRPLELYQMPGTFYEDVTFDGKPDLLVSPAYLADGSENRKSVLLYTNTGTSSTPNFQYTQNDFLQNQMIDVGEGAIPRLVDLNGDSLLDLVVANYGSYINPNSQRHFYQLYMNTGTATQPQFTLTDTNFVNISSYGLGNGSIPTFGDLDGDGDQDMIVGDENGNLHLFTNSSATSPSFSLQSSATISSINVGNNAAPFLFDVDQDGDLDLMIGNRRGHLYYYSNSSATSPNFTKESDFYGAVDTRNVATSVYGEAIPYLINDKGTVDLFVGSESEGIYQFDSVASVNASPPIITKTIGQGTIVSQNTDETPFGIVKKSGRHQILVRASEMKAQGLSYGYLTDIRFEIASTNNNTIYNLKIKVKATTDSVLTGFESGFTEVSYDQPVYFGAGWNNISFLHPFLWDGTSNLIFEVCYSDMPSANNITVKMNDVGYDCYAVGDVTNFNQYGKNGCAMPFKNVLTKRPNLQLSITPAFYEAATYGGKGYRLAPAIADLNDDGYPDMILGNYSGGLSYFSGEEYKVGLKEPAPIKSNTLNVFPNPGSGKYTIVTPASAHGILRVFDLSGKMIKTIAVSEIETTVDLSNNAPGVYLFLYQDKEGIQTQKVIKN